MVRRAAPVMALQKIMVINTKAINPAVKAMPEAPMASPTVMATTPVVKPEKLYGFQKATAPL